MMSERDEGCILVNDRSPGVILWNSGEIYMR